MTLELRDAAGQAIVESVVIDWGCTNSYFFVPEPQRCPHPAAPINAVLQVFEGGRLVWLENVNGNGQDGILALYDDGTFQAFPDNWQEGDPVDDPNTSPPSGFFQPVRGFGLVWREQPGVGDRMGWARAQEVAFQATIQYQMVESVPGQAYLQLLAGEIIYLPLDVPFGEWQRIN